MKRIAWWGMAHLILLAAAPRALADGPAPIDAVEAPSEEVTLAPESLQPAPIGVTVQPIDPNAARNALGGREKTGEPAPEKPEEPLSRSEMQNARRWVKHLSDDTYTVREKAQENLIALGRKAPKQIREILAEAPNDPETQFRCEEIRKALDPVANQPPLQIPALGGPFGNLLTPEMIARIQELHAARRAGVLPPAGGAGGPIQIKTDKGGAPEEGGKEGGEEGEKKE